MESETRERREAFVSGHNGGSYDIVIVTAMIPQIAIITTQLLISTFPIVDRSRLARIFIENALTFGLLILSVTVWSSVVHEVLAILCGITLLLFVLNRLKYKGQNIIHKPIGRIPTVSVAMSGTMISTCVAIIAVDFPLFPRSLAKTEIQGFGWMDLGVGLFLCINGYISADARETTLSGISLKSRMDRIRRTVSTSIPLVVLGIGRLLFIKIVNYQSHVTEYGVHWNFFFTLALTRIMGCMLWNLSGSRIVSFTIALGTLALHQYALDKLGLKEFILNENRNGFLTANKEGITSLFSTVPLHLIFIEFGKRFVHHKDRLASKNFILLGVLILVLTTLCSISQGHFVISRREHNLTFALWIGTFASLKTLLGLLAEVIFLNTPNLPSDISGQKLTSKTPVMYSVASQPLYQLISRHALVTFLIANLLTGLINLSLEPMRVGKENPLVTILGLWIYSLTLTGWIYLFDWHCKGGDLKKQLESSKRD